MSRKILFLALLSLLLLPAAARDRSDTIYTFRFVAGDDMFYVPWSGNGVELERLLACVGQNRTAILDGSVPVLVNGYCDSQPLAAENLAMAKIRSNRVKTALIMRGGLTEECFRTMNHTSGGNYVTVRIVIPAEPAPEVPAPSETEPVPAVEESPASESDAQSQSVPDCGIEPAFESGDMSGLSLRANLLRWATLTPDLGVEWRIGASWGVAVNGSWTSWTWNDNARRFALWEVAPEVRCYMGLKKRGYLGAMFKIGQFNYKFSDMGRQGDILGGGLTGGYVQPIGKRLALDFSLGVGCLNAEYDKYTVVDGMRVRQGAETKTWWGPINAGITLKWNLF